MSSHRILMGLAISAALTFFAAGPEIRNARSVLAADPELRLPLPKPKPKAQVKARRPKPRPEPVENEPDRSTAAPAPSVQPIAHPTAAGEALSGPRPTVQALMERVRASPRAQAPLRPAHLVGRWSLYQDQDISVSISDQQPDGAFRGSFYSVPNPGFSGSVNGTVTVNSFRMLMHWNVLFVKGRRELNGACEPSGDRIQGNWAGNSGLGMASGAFNMDRIR